MQEVLGLGIALIGLGAWLEVEEGTLVEVIDQQAFLAGPYLIIVVGIAIVLIAFVGMVGAMCDHLINRILLYIVSVHITHICVHVSPQTSDHSTSLL